MPADGKVSEEFFRTRIATRLGADREDVRLGPKHGCDFGVIRGSGEETATVLATDPISILPDLGFERAGRFALHIVLSDVAVSGIAPSHLSIAFSLPSDMTDEAFDRVWTAIHEECVDLGIAVTTGHTARYPGSTFPWVGAATAIGRGDPDRIVRPDGARPGDRIVVTKGPAVEATGLFASLFPEALDGLPPEVVATAQRRLDDVRLVGDALALADHDGVHAMHDATEGGLLGAFHELASAGEVRLRVETERVPRQPGVEEVCDALGMDPWRATTAGTLLAAVDPAVADDVVTALRDRGTPAAVVGEVLEVEDPGDAGNAPVRVVVDGEETEPPAGDSSWPVYARLSGTR
ncbi:AIR synthase family protein [Halopenitus persicus]|uniref:Hydrogenase maturation factor n=1 Tax=Halopenitus persicus TaxID=1048396 RepID=A0A1H3DSD0_9EURY|nr:AIR synthase family protein [Halopenitus persicus]SDX69433.1 Hydrogenase maturation factor [Halopenitus persicus]